MDMLGIRFKRKEKKNTSTRKQMPHADLRKIATHQNR